MKDYYNTLKIDRNASQEEIKKAYFSLIGAYPSDKHPKEFEKIHEAYEILSDESTRTQYDAVNVMPEIVQSYFREGQKALEADQVEDAIRLLEEVHKVYPNFSIVNNLRGKVYLLNENSGKAMRIFKSLLTKEQNNAGYVRNLAHAYAMRGFHNKAIAYYEKALTLDENNFSLWLGLIDCYLEVEDSERAKEITLAALEVSSKNGWDSLPLYVHIILADISFNNHEDLLKHLAEMKECALASKEPQANIAWHFARLAQKINDYGFHQESAELLATAIVLAPDDECVLQIKDEVDSQNELIQQLDKLADDDHISLEIDDMLQFELNLCENEDCLDSEVTQFMHEVDIIIAIDTYRKDITRLKNNNPDLYNLKKTFFDDILNLEKEEGLLDTYRKKLAKYEKLCPERFETIDDGDDYDEPIPQTYVRPEPKVGRNDPCPCGSGKKYKKCCGG
jgi:tetratricopeptide (TPR) repeat protein